MPPQLIMTRPAPASARFVDALRQALHVEFDVILSPLVQIVPCGAVLEKIPAHVIFTSSHAVAQAANLGLPPGLLRGLPAWCVGDRTAAVATSAGFQAISAKGNADDLLALIKRENPVGTMLHLHGREVHLNFASALGPRCCGLCVYDQVPQHLTPQAQEALSGSDPVIVPLFSPKATALFVSQAMIAAPTHLVTISATAADAAVGLNASATLTCAKTPDLVGMVEQTKQVFVTL